MTVPSDETQTQDYLAQLRERHRQIARYRVYLLDWRKPKGRQKTYLESGLTYDAAVRTTRAANERLRLDGKTGFADPAYHFELENLDETLTPAAKARQRSMGGLADVPTKNR